MAYRMTHIFGRGWRQNAGTNAVRETSGVAPAWGEALEMPGLRPNG